MLMAYETPDDLRNHIVEYKGGGYDGCWWQWNYFMFDRDGTFWNVLSTGRKGVKDEAEARALFDLTDKEKSDIRLSFTNLADPKDMWDFVDGMNAEFAILIDKFMREHDLGKLWGHCYECGELRQVRYMNPENYGSDGGVTYVAHDLMCASCAREEEVIE